jgi:hypothetical protein
MTVDDALQRLVELLTVLIAWRSGFSRKYPSPALGPDREQHEIALLLEEHPALATEESIRGVHPRRHRRGASCGSAGVASRSPAPVAVHA